MSCLQLCGTSSCSWPLPCVEYRWGPFAHWGENDHDPSIWKGERKQGEYEELYNLMPTIHARLQCACLRHSICDEGFKNAAAFCFLFPCLPVLVFNLLCHFHSRSWDMLKIEANDTWNKKYCFFFFFLSYHTALAFLSDVITTGVTLT